MCLKQGPHGREGKEKWWARYLHPRHFSCTKIRYTPLQNILMVVHPNFVSSDGILKKSISIRYNIFQNLYRYIDIISIFLKCL